MASIEEYLNSKGYEKATPSEIEIYAESAVEILSGKRKQSGRPDENLRLPFTRDIVDRLANNEKKYVLVEGEYLHYYQYFETAYLDASGILFETEFSTDFDLYGQAGEDTRPGTGSPSAIAEFDRKIEEAKEKFREKYDFQLGTDESRGDWPKTLNEAERQQPEKDKKKSKKTGIRKNKSLASDRARKAKKKLEEDKRRLTQQSLLLLNLEELSRLNKDVYHPDGYENFMCVEDSEPSTFMSRLMGINFLPISKIKNNEMSSLVPEMRFFKIDLDPGTNKTKGKREVFFPTFAGIDQKSRYTANIMSDFNDLIADGSPNIGVKSVEWSNRTGNALLEKTSLQFNVQIYAERISDLFAKVVGQSDSDFKYSDLFTFSSRYLDNDTDKPRKDREYNQNYYRMQAQFGWRLSEKMGKELKSLDTGARERLEKLADFKMTVDLSLVNFDLDFNEDGSAILNLTYHSFVESYTKDNEKTNVLMSPEEVKLHQKLKQVEAKAEKEKNQIKKNTASKSGSKSAVSQSTKKELKEVEKQIKDTQSNLNTRFSSIIKRLVEKQSIRVYKVKDNEILRRYQTTGLETTENFKTPDGFEHLESVSKQFGTDDYEELSIIEVTDKNSESYNVAESVVSSLILKKVKQKSTGKIFYLAYYNGSSQASTSSNLHNGAFVPEENLRGKLGSFPETKIKKTASSKKSKSAPDQSANQMVENATLPRTTVQQIDKDLDKAIKQLSQNYYDSNKKEFNIKFFYLGDLIEVAVENLYEHGGVSTDFKVIAGSVALKNFVGYDVMENFFTVNTTGGVLEITRTEAGDDYVESQSGGKSTAKIKLNAHHYCRNIADIPISLSAFLNTFNDLIIKKKRVNLSFHEMIKVAYKMAIASLNSIDDEFYALPRQGVNLSQTIISAPRLLNRDYGYFGEKKKNDTKMEFKDGKGRREFEKGPTAIRLQAPSVLSDNGISSPEQATNATRVSLFEQRYASSQSKSELTDDYIILHDMPRTVPPSKIADFETDSVNGIPHFFIGASTGMVKNIKFSLKENPLLQADQMLRRADTTYPKFPIKGIYEAEVTMVGNVFLSPGSTVYINPASMKLGNPANPNSPINSLGISGYYIVLRSSSYVQEGTYETKLNCKFQSPGNGLDRMGTNYINVPTREEINLRKSRRGK